MVKLLEIKHIFHCIFSIVLLISLLDKEVSLGVGKELLSEETPQRCKRYSLGNYRFNNCCAYK